MMRKIVCGIVLAASLLAGVVGCTSEIKYAFTDGVADFVGTTVAESLKALFPIADIIKGQTAE